MDQTICAYDATATAYAERWFDLRLYDEMARFTERLAAGARVLDAGCGPGRDAAWLAEQGYAAMGVDLSGGMLREGRARGVTVPLIQADIGHLPFEQGSFDGVWACASLLHIPRSRLPKVLQELARVVHPGLFYAAVKGGSGHEWIESAGGRHLFVYWRLSELRMAISGAGFEVLGCWETADRAGRQHPWIGILARSEVPD